MKKLLLLILCACHFGTPYVPAGYKACRSDADCDLDAEYCGFVAVDTYAVCKSKPFEYNWGLNH